MQRKILVTGVSRGLGLAMTEGFVAGGHTVWGCARSETKVKELCRRWQSPHDFEVVDVSRDDEVRGWAKRAVKAGFVPDLLVNNAALVNQNAALWEVSADEFDQVVAVNISGVANVVRHFVPLMLPQAEGVIVNFSSGWGRSVSPEVAAYCATKWAIEGLTRALAEELPKGMAAVPLNPGIIDTDMLRSCFGADAASYPSPGEWANQAVPFLLSLGPKDNGKPLTVPGQ
ncbi:MAG TPA: SDR family oxidoreductase [Pirellulales bacterium]|nr:SDR family oxidoreductase [Pirellulales bacterium]